MEVDTTDLDAQIAALQAAKANKVAEAEKIQRRQAAEEAKVLIGSTPTKPKVHESHGPIELLTRPSQPVFAGAKSAKPTRPVQSLPTIPTRPGASSMSSSLAAMRHTNRAATSQRPSSTQRSTSFSKRPNAKAGPSTSRKRSVSPDDELEVGSPGVQRNEDDMTIINNLEPGPKSFGKDPEGEEEWLHLEPNSRIRLIKRILSHEALQEQLYGRYFLPPSLLYSVIRLSKDGATYDIPVDGDWVTIAVVAERSEIRVSGSKEAVSDEEEDETGEVKVKQGDKPKSKETREKEKWLKRKGPRKYLNLKLCSLPSRAELKGEKSTSGDALLQLLLFESDAKIHGSTGDDGEKSNPIYKGGSGGAYEQWCNLAVGSVIAILNPRVLRPMKGGPQAPHPLTLPLALNPNSADAITLIGQSKDLGCCSATQKDGKRCRTWVDLRQNEVCEYHIHAAVQRSRSGRAEFTASTSSFALSSAPPRGGQYTKYNPAKKEGLLPNNGPQAAPRDRENGGGGVTYVVGGNAINTRSDGGFKGFGNEHIGEKLGRGRATKRQKKLEAQEAEKALSKLLEADGKSGSAGAKYLTKLGLQKEKSQTQRNAAEMEERKRPFSAGAIKRIGFDPTARRGDRNEEETAKRLEAISSLKENTDRPINLSRPPGLPKSNVRVPKESPPVSKRNDEEMIDLD